MNKNMFSTMTRIKEYLQRSDTELAEAEERLSVFVFSIRKEKRSLFQSNFVKPKFFFVNFVVYRPEEEANVVLSLSCPTDQETVIWS